jgi:hypothetical protein
MATKSTARRLRRTRQHLGTYRHELIVAMRVVNNVDREMLRAEWENWLIDENTRCKQVQALLQDNRAGISATKKGKGANAQQILARKGERLEALRTWQEDYCGSCKIEQELLQEGKKHLTFG